MGIKVFLFRDIRDVKFPYQPDFFDILIRTRVPKKRKKTARSSARYIREQTKLRKISMGIKSPESDLGGAAPRRRKKNNTDGARRRNCFEFCIAENLITFYTEFIIYKYGGIVKRQNEVLSAGQKLTITMAKIVGFFCLHAGGLVKIEER